MSRSNGRKAPSFGAVRAAQRITCKSMDSHSKTPVKGGAMTPLELAHMIDDETAVLQLVTAVEHYLHTFRDSMPHDQAYRISFTYRLLHDALEAHKAKR